MLPPEIDDSHRPFHDKIWKNEIQYWVTSAKYHKRYSMALERELRSVLNEVYKHDKQLFMKIMTKAPLMELKQKKL
jgi:hypothetical protein